MGASPAVFPFQKKGRVNAELCSLIPSEHDRCRDIGTKVFPQTHGGRAWSKGNGRKQIVENLQHWWRLEESTCARCSVIPSTGGPQRIAHWCALQLRAIVCAAKQHQ